MDIKGNALGCWVIVLLSVSSLVAGGDLRLVDAVKNKDTDAVRSLMKQHVDVNTPDAAGSTALAWAAHWNDLETADLLIRAGANGKTMNELGDTPLLEACNNANAAMVEKLANAGADPNAILLGTGETALMRCARTGSTEAVESLLAHAADVNAKELRKGQTALMWALEERHSGVARVLIEHGSDIHAKTKGGFTPLLYAARQGDLESAQMLVDKGVDVNEAGPGGLNALFVAIDSGHEDFAIFLVEKGANPNAADPNGLTPLHYSLRRGISLLTNKIRDTRYVGGGYPLEYLFRPDMAKLVAVLLGRGANPNVRIQKGTKFSAMLHVSDRPRSSMVGATPFLLAAAVGDVGLMKTLLAKGADPTLATNDGMTPLLAAAGVGRAEDRTEAEEAQSLAAVKLLVELGADPNGANDEGSTAMHGAALTGADDIIQFLVDKGAKVDSEDKFGQTPLSIAESDPNGLVDDHEKAPFHQSTVNLIRRLSGLPPMGGAELASEKASQ